MQYVGELLSELLFMATSNRRVAAYFPEELDRIFRDYKIQNGFATKKEPNSNDSKALISIVSQFLRLESRIASSGMLPDDASTVDHLDHFLLELLDETSTLSGRLDALEKRFEHELLSVLPKDNSIEEVPKVNGQLDLLSTNTDATLVDVETVESLPEEKVPQKLLEGLSAKALAARLTDTTAMQIGKKKKQEDFSRWAGRKDPDGIPWVYRGKRYYPLTQSITTDSV